MARYRIVLGNKRYSSWSLRGWLALRRTGVDFEEVVIPLDRPESKAALLAHSPSGRVPALDVDGTTVWDSLAIAEWLHERFPDAALWPEDPDARAVARAVAAEMHSGFAALRDACPMDLMTHDPERGRRAMRDPAVAADIARIAQIWTDCRARFGIGGDLLFGAFSAADAFYAPVAARFAGYDIALEGPPAAYCAALLAWPDMALWCAAAAEEPWIIAAP